MARRADASEWGADHANLHGRSQPGGLLGTLHHQMRPKGGKHEVFFTGQTVVGGAH